MATLAPPVPPSPPASSLSSFSAVPPKDVSSSSQDEPPKVYRLPDADLHIVWEALGAASDDERHSLLHPKNFIYPPKGLPDGLYRDVIRSRVVSQYQFFFCSFFFNIALVLQILLGAALTALGSNSKGRDTYITILAAANTVVAGLLALMHNSGMPDRYKNDWTEFDRVEMYLKELIDSGIVKEGLSRDQAIEHCYELYRMAKQTVARNKPAAYMSNRSANSSTANLIR
jgi:hypothetical protein